LNLHKPQSIKPRLTTKERGYDHRWQKTRFRKLKETPLCEFGFDGCQIGANHVHHRDHNPKNNKPENLLSSCGPCHMTYHRKSKAARLDNG
jgi:5-methylcytosine-specific restriction endonuclease McrA